MIDGRSIYEFANEWRRRFSLKVINEEIFPYGLMLDECEGLCFDVEYSTDFRKQYRMELYDNNLSIKILNSIEDISLIGSVIYERLIEFDEWKTYSEQIDLAKKYRLWFLVALNKLSHLSRKNPLVFKGTPKEIKIGSYRSNIMNRNYLYNDINMNDFKNGTININNCGDVTFEDIFAKKDFIEEAFIEGFIEEDFTEEGFIEEDFAEEDSNPINDEKVNFFYLKIDKEKSENIINEVADYFTNHYKIVYEIPYKDGYWEVETTNTDDEKYTFYGSLNNFITAKQVHISDLIRSATNMNNLYLLDYNKRHNMVSKIVLEYENSVYEIFENPVEDIALHYETQVIEQKLILDREANTFEFYKYINGIEQYHYKKGMSYYIDKVLKYCEYENFLESDEEVFDEEESDIKRYKITIDYYKNSQRITEGSFNKYGLPKDYPKFIEAIETYFDIDKTDTIFDSDLYNNPKDSENKHIYCSIIFQSGGKKYYYITEDNNIKVGDYVVVGVGIYNYEKIVEVVAVEHFEYDDVPFPLEHVKSILRIATDEDFDELD